MTQVLAAFVAACAVIAAPACAQEASFPDVPRGHWAYEALRQVSEAGLIEGRPDGTFGGARPVTRYEFAVVMARVSQLTGVARTKTTTTFPDVTRGHWASQALSTARYLGILGGLPNGKFYGSLPMTRYQSAVACSRMMSMMWQARSYPTQPDPLGRQPPEPRPEPNIDLIQMLTGTIFPDVESKHWAHNAVERVVVGGVFEGCADDKFHGASPVTRYAFALALARLSQPVFG